MDSNQKVHAHAIFAIKMAIYFNMHNKKKTYVLAVDAFEKVNRVALWFEEIGRKINLPYKITHGI